MCININVGSDDIFDISLRASIVSSLISVRHSANCLSYIFVLVFLKLCMVSKKFSAGSFSFSAPGHEEIQQLLVPH